jgi:hypothetical protein
MYARASATERSRFHETIRPFIQANEKDPRWRRTQERLLLAPTYPLANAVIAYSQRTGSHYTEAVKVGLFTVTVLAVLLTVLLARTTPFGLWSTLVTMNLVALTGRGAEVIDAWLTYNQYPLTVYLPFLSYVPRGAAALLVLPTVLFIAAKRPWPALASLLLMFLWHIALATVFTGLIVVSLLLWSTSHWPLRLTILRRADFWQRAFLLSALLLGVSVMLAVAASFPPFSRLIQQVVQLTVAEQLSERLAGIQWVLLVLLGVLAWRPVFVPRLNPRSGTVAALVISLLALLHTPLLLRVPRGDSGFFEPTCQQAHILSLPDHLDELSLDDEPTLFLSLGHFLLELHRR